jgi:hypothetical protein
MRRKLFQPLYQATPLVVKSMDVLGLPNWVRSGVSETDLRQFCDNLQPTSNGSGFSFPWPHTPIDLASQKPFDFCSLVPVSAVHAQQGFVMFRHVSGLLAASLRLSISCVDISCGRPRHTIFRPFVSAS